MRCSKLLLALSALIATALTLSACAGSPVQVGESPTIPSESAVVAPGESPASADEEGEGRIYVSNGCAHYIDGNGKLYGWGWLPSPVGEETLTETPTEIDVPGRVVDLAPGSISVALCESGNMYSWGTTFFGSGIDDVEYQPREIDLTPRLVNVPEKIARIFNGHGGVGLAQGESGVTYIWGWNLQGLLANGSTEHCMEPIVLNIPSQVVDISTYDTHVVALCEDGKVYTWGSNYFGELGDGSELEMSSCGLIERNRLLPDTVQLDDTIVSVAAGRGATYALSQNGELYSWGANDVGQLGVGEQVEFSSSPMKVPLDKKIISVTAGAFHTYAITEDGELWDWGYNSREYEDMSVLGIGSYELIIYTPTKINIEKPIEYVTAGATHSFAVARDGTIFSWGGNGVIAQALDKDENVDVPTVWAWPG